MKIGFRKVFISVPILSLFSKFFFCWKAGVFVIIFLMEKISNSHFLVFKEHQHSMTLTIFFHLQSEHKRQIFFFFKKLFFYGQMPFKRATDHFLALNTRRDTIHVAFTLSCWCSQKSEIFQNQKIFHFIAVAFRQKEFWKKTKYS